MTGPDGADRPKAPPKGLPGAPAKPFERLSAGPTSAASSVCAMQRKRGLAWRRQARRHFPVRFTTVPNVRNRMPRSPRNVQCDT